MKLTILKSLALFNLLLGVSVLLSLWVGSSSWFALIENAFYKGVFVANGKITMDDAMHSKAERVQIIGTEETKSQDEFRWNLSVYMDSPAPKIVVVEVGEDPDKVFQENPLASMDYAVVFYQLRELGAKNVAVTSPLTWPPPQDPLYEEALGYEIDEFNKAAVGLVLTPSARRMAPPAYMEKLFIPEERVYGKIALVPSGGKVIDFPHLRSVPRISFAPMRIETEPDVIDSPEGKRVPLLMRWNNHLVPTLPLVTVMNVLQVRPSNVTVELGKSINIGNKRIIPIDESGAVLVSPESVSSVKRICAASVVATPGQDTSALEAALLDSQVVVVGEGTTPYADLRLDKLTNTPWNWNQTLDVVSAAVQSVLQGKQLGKPFSLLRLDQVRQMTILALSILFLTVAIMLRKSLWVRSFILLISWVVGLGSAALWAVEFNLWLPLSPIFLALVLGSILFFIQTRPIDTVVDESDSEIDKESTEEIPPPFTEAS